MAIMMGFFMVLVRTSAFFLVGPIFGARLIPTQFRIALVLLLSILFAWLSPEPYLALGITMTEVVIALSLEAVYGLAFGLVAILIFSVIKIAARVIEHQMGFVMAQTLDPLSGEDAQPLSMLMGNVVYTPVFCGEWASYAYNADEAEFCPVSCGDGAQSAGLCGVCHRAGSSMFMAALRLSAPLLCAFLLLMTTLAVFARIMPDMDILFLSMPLRAGMGLLFLRDGDAVFAGICH